jgi:hypothetical protein
VTTIGYQRSQELVDLHPDIKHDPLLPAGTWGTIPIVFAKVSYPLPSSIPRRMI